MDKKKYIIGAALVLILIIVALFMFKGKQPNNEDTDTSLTSNSNEASDTDSKEYELTYIVDGDSEGATAKIDEYIPSMGAEEIQETLDKEVSKDQKDAIEQALKDNEIPLKTQELQELKDMEYLNNNLAAMQELIIYNLNTLFNEFLTEANQGKYEYEKIGAMLATYANNLQKDIKESGQFTEDELEGQVQKELVIKKRE